MLERLAAWFGGHKQRKRDEPRAAPPLVLRRPHLWDYSAYPQLCRYCLQPRTVDVEATECPRVTL